MPSTAIDWVYWRNNILSVKFRGGDAYDYLDVPEHIYCDLMASRSKGQFVNSIIKPNYRYRKRERARAQ
jgi:hypothetical protein